MPDCNHSHIDHIQITFQPGDIVTTRLRFKDVELSTPENPVMLPIMDLMVWGEPIMMADKEMRTVFFLEPGQTEPKKDETQKVAVLPSSILTLKRW